MWKTPFILVAAHIGGETPHVETPWWPPICRKGETPLLEGEGRLGHPLGDPSEAAPLGCSNQSRHGGVGPIYRFKWLGLGEEVRWLGCNLI